jgi:hypothetical protein
LKRNNSQPREVEVCEVFAVRGGFLKEPVPLEITEHGGQRFAKALATSPWLVGVVSGARSNRPNSAVICAALSAVKAELCSNSATQDSPIPQVAADIAARRAESGLSADEADGDDDSAGSDVEPLLKRRRPAGRAKVGLNAQEITARGVVMVAALHKNAIYVKADSTNIAALVKLVRALTQEDMQEKKGTKKKALHDVYGASSEESRSLVQYLFSRKTWTIHYIDKDGKSHQIVKGLAPSTTDRLGNKLKPEEFKKEIEQKRKAAVRLWNTLDESGRPRMDDA